MRIGQLGRLVIGVGRIRRGQLLNYMGARVKLLMFYGLAFADVGSDNVITNSKQTICFVGWRVGKEDLKVYLTDSDTVVIQ